MHDLHVAGACFAFDHVARVSGCRPNSPDEQDDTPRGQQEWQLVLHGAYSSA
jgi:hypothetical protein